MPAVIDVSKTDDPRDVVHLAVQALAEGKLVAFPSETVYGVAASALHEGAVTRLEQLARRVSPDGCGLVVRSCDEALDYAPQLSPLGQRLARRCWPGPLTLEIPGAPTDSLVTRLPPITRNILMARGQLSLRVPAHSLINSALRFAIGPIVWSKVMVGENQWAATAQELVHTVGDEVAMVPVSYTHLTLPTKA